jgi:hypothetical protein
MHMELNREPGARGRIRSFGQRSVNSILELRGPGLVNRARPRENDAHHRPPLEPPQSVCVTRDAGQRLDDRRPNRRGIIAGAILDRHQQKNHRLIRAIRALPLPDQNILEEIFRDDESTVRWAPPDL